MLDFEEFSQIKSKYVWWAIRGFSSRRV